MKPVLLDLYCKQGGAAKGYADAGFDVVGVDTEPQPRYPFEFIQRDAIELLNDWDFPLEDFDAVHASPPCHAYSMLRTLQGDREYPELVEPTRTALLAVNKPYVIENVVGAPLLNPVMLCGSSFGKRLRRHRLFECHGFAVMAPPCAHGWQMDRKFPALNGDDRKAGKRSGIVGVYGNGGDKRADLWPAEMAIDWMDRDGLTQAIPPYYTEHIGSYLMAALTTERAA